MTKLKTELKPAAKPNVRRQTSSEIKISDQEAPQRAPDHEAPSNPVRPGGKLGLIADRLTTNAGATADELMAMTGWQRHTVFAALSRLRTRGLSMRLESDGDRKAYRLERSER